LIEVSLPLPSSTMGLPSNVITLGGASTNGLAVSGGTMARLNVAATANSIQGAVRIYYGATGTLSQATIPAGAFEIELSGEYTTT
jgi:hypothetical protein